MSRSLYELYESEYINVNALRVLGCHVYILENDNLIKFNVFLSNFMCAFYQKISILRRVYQHISDPIHLTTGLRGSVEKGQS